MKFRGKPFLLPAPAAGKVTKSNAQFPTDDALVKMLLAMREATRKWTVRIQHWAEILGHLQIYFGERVRQPLQDLER